MKKNLFMMLLLPTLAFSIGPHCTYAMEQKQIEKLEDLSLVLDLPNELWFVFCIFLPVGDLQNLSFVSRDINSKVKIVMEQLFGKKFNLVRINRLKGDENEFALSLYLSSLDAYPADGHSTFDQALTRCKKVKSSKERGIPPIIRAYRDLKSRLRLAVLFAKNRNHCKAKVLLKKQLKIIRKIARERDDGSRNYWGLVWRNDGQDLGYSLGLCLWLDLNVYADKILQSQYLSHGKLVEAARTVAKKCDKVEIIKFLCEEVKLDWIRRELISLADLWRKGESRNNLNYLWDTAVRGPGQEARVGILCYLWHTFEFLQADRRLHKFKLYHHYDLRDKLGIDFSEIKKEEETKKVTDDEEDYCTIL